MDSGGVVSQVAESAHDAGSGVAGEAKNFGKTFFSQIFGRRDEPELKHHEIKQKDKEDEQWSEQQKAYVKSVYNEYYAKKKRQEQIERQHEQQAEEAKKLEDLNEKKVNRQKAAELIRTKSSAETGRNYGQE